MLRHQNFIDGKWVDGSAGWLDIEDPATGETIGQQALGKDNDINAAVAAARQCASRGELAAMRPVERGRMVKAIGEYILENKKEIAPILTLEAGKPLWEADIEVAGSARYFEYYGNQAETLEGRSIPLGDSYIDFTTLEPYGVSAQIIPWNYPLEMAARSISTALTAGNACVVKSPELDPLTHDFLARAADAVGLPAGALNIVCGYGEVAGAALAAHKDVNQIVFTGSVETGASVATAAAKNIVPCVLELGGKSAAIIHDDADIERVLSSVRWGIFFHAGQVCSALSRLVVHESRHDEVVDAVAELARSINVAPGSELPEFGNNMGPMVSQKQRDRAESICIEAVQQGAKTVAGGHKLNRSGWFFEPTVFDDVTADMKIANEEVFGPVLSVQRFRDDNEAIQIANASEYGLVGGVFTQDSERAISAAKQLRAGQIFVNEWYAGGVETPFGGYGKSGYGREKGREALYNYVQTKNIAIALKGE